MKLHNIFISEAKQMTSCLFLFSKTYRGLTPYGSLATNILVFSGLLSSNTNEKTPSKICNVYSIPNFK